jgi:hypothetical protein
LARIFIDSRDAEADKAELRRCRDTLFEAKQQLYRICNSLNNTSRRWEGQSTWRCFEFVDGFAGQAEKLMEKADLTIKRLDVMVDTFVEYDVAISKKSSGGGRN